MNQLSRPELEQIAQSQKGILGDVVALEKEGAPMPPFFQLDPGEVAPEGYRAVSVLGIIFHLLDLDGLLMPTIDVRHGDPVRAAQQFAEAYSQQIESIKCTVCGKLLAGDLDTYGDVHMPLCWQCLGTMNGETITSYGLRPHHHDLSITGSIIGSTVFDVGDDDPDFTPDPDAPSLGFWTQRPASGWK